MMNGSMDTNCLCSIIQNIVNILLRYKKDLKYLYLHKCISKKVTEQIIVNPIIVFAANFFNFLKIESK